MKQIYYELSTNDLYKIIRISTKLQSSGQVILAFNAALQRKKLNADSLLLDEEDEDNTELDISDMKDIPKNLQGVANALFGAVEGGETAAPPLSMPLAANSRKSD